MKSIKGNGLGERFLPATVDLINPGISSLIPLDPLFSFPFQNSYKDWSALLPLLKSLCPEFGLWPDSDLGIRLLFTKLWCRIPRPWKNHLQHHLFLSSPSRYALHDQGFFSCRTGFGFKEIDSLHARPLYIIYAFIHAFWVKIIY